MHQHSLISPLKQVPGPSLALIESLGIDAIQLPHADRKVSVGCFDKKMIMIIHQAIGMTEPMVTAHTTLKDIQEIFTVMIIPENFFSLIAPARNMIYGSGEFYP